MPTMPDIAGGYARIGEQIAGVGKQIGGAIVDFASAQGKKKLVDEIKVKYPSVVQAYPEDVLMQMDNKELGTRLAAVVGIENAIPKLKEIDPKFSTADIEQMKAEIFKQPDQARTIAKDWMAIAEKNRKEADTQQADAQLKDQTELMGTGMPLVSKALQGTKPISDKDLAAETSALLSNDAPPMPLATSSVEKYKGVPIREQAFGEAAQMGTDISKSSAPAREAYEKATIPMSQVLTDQNRDAKLKDAKSRMIAQAKRHAAEMKLGYATLGIDAATKADNLSEKQAENYTKYEETMLAANSETNPETKKGLEKIAQTYLKRAYNLDEKITATQSHAAGVQKLIEDMYKQVGDNVKVDKAVASAKEDFQSDFTANKEFYAKKGVKSWDDYVKKYPEQAKQAIATFVK